MSDESTPAPEKAAAETEPTPKVRRISNKNPKKATKPDKKQQAPEHEVPVEEFESAAPVADDSKEDKPESSGDPKRKNRRRRGKGKSSQKDADSSGEGTPLSEETVNLTDGGSEESNPRQGKQAGRKDQQNQRPPQKQSPKLDMDKVAKNAWKIFLAEVSEEGVALIGDNDARELARRCFRLSEIFLEEESRRN